MTGHLSADDVERYQRAPAAALLTFDDHLATCAECRSRVAASSRADERVSALRADLRDAATMDDDHLNYEELAAYTDGSLGKVESEMIEGHLAVCLVCEEEVRDLLAFKEAATPHFQTEYAPAAVSHRPAETKPPLLAFLFPSTPGVGFWRVGLAAAAVLLVAIVIGWFVWRPKLRSQPEIVQTPKSSPSATPAPASSPSPAVPAPEALLAMNDGGGRVTVDREGNLKGAGVLTAAQGDAVKAALQSQRVVNSASLAGLGQAGALRSASPEVEDFIVRSPVGTVVEIVRPVLNWDALSGATAYRVTIYDSNFNAVMASGELQTTSWTVPKALARGAIYSWQVTALKEGREIKSPQPPAPEAKFKVLDASRAAELQRLNNSQPRSNLVLGVLYARAGLLDNAEREFAALVRANPQSEVARKLLSEVRAARKR